MEATFPHPKSSTVIDGVLRFPEAQVNITAAYLRGLPTDATRVVYRRAIRQFRDFHVDGDVFTATRRDIEAFRAHLEALGRAPATVSKTMAALTGLFGFALDEGIVERNVARSARRPKVPTVSPRQGLSPAEVHALLDVLDLDTLIGRRDRVLLLLLAVQAWRISEALGLRVEDLGDEAGHHVATITGKGHKVCRVPLAATTWDAISLWLDSADITAGAIVLPVLKGGKVQPGTAMSSQSAWRRIRRIGQQAGLTRPVHPHLFRHGAATALLDQGVPLRELHSERQDPQTTWTSEAAVGCDTGPRTQANRVAFRRRCCGGAGEAIVRAEQDTDTGPAYAFCGRVVMAHHVVLTSSLATMTEELEIRFLELLNEVAGVLPLEMRVSKAASKHFGSAAEFRRSDVPRDYAIDDQCLRVPLLSPAREMEIVLTESGDPSRYPSQIQLTVADIERSGLWPLDVLAGFIARVADELKFDAAYVCEESQVDDVVYAERTCDLDLAQAPLGVFWVNFFSHRVLSNIGEGASGFIRREAALIREAESGLVFALPVGGPGQHVGLRRAMCVMSSSCYMAKGV